MNIIRNISKKNIYKVYTIIFMIFSVVIFFPLLIYHNSFIATGDSYNQFYPVLVYLSKYYRNIIQMLFQGKFPMYDLSIGFGDDIIGTLSYYGLGDILLLPAIFFPARYMSYAYTLISLSRIYISGLTFILFARSKKISKRGILIGTLMYVFSYYSLEFGFTAYTFLSAPVYFPLIIGGIDQIVEKKENARKWQIIFISMIFLQAMNGFYFLYIDILGGIIYYIYKLVVSYRDHSIKMGIALSRLWTIIYSGLIGTGMAAVILLPVIKEYFQGTRSGDSISSISNIFRFPTLHELAILIKNIITPATSAYEIGLAVPVATIVCAIFLFMHHKEAALKHKISMCLLAILGYFIPTFGIVASGFEFNSSRWFYMLIFMLSILTAELLPLLIERVTLNDCRVIAAGAIVWLISAIVLNQHTRAATIRICIFCVIWLITVAFLVARTKGRNFRINNLIWITVAVNILINAFLIYAPQKIGGIDLGVTYKGLNFAYSEIWDSKLGQVALTRDKTDEYSRYDINDTALNAPLVLGVNTTYLYYSLCNGSVFDFYNELRVSPGINDTFHFEGLDGRQVLETILSVKKYAVDSTSGVVKDNKFYLPMGIMYHKAITERKVSSLSRLQKMNLMMNHVIVDGSSNVSTTLEKSDYGNETKMPITLSYGNDIIRKGNILKVKANSVIHISFDKSLCSRKNGDELYLYLKNLTSEPSFEAHLDIAGKSVRLRPKSTEWYYDNNYDYLVQIQNMAEKGYVDISFRDAGEYTLDDIQIVENRIPLFEEQYKELKQNVLNNAELFTNGFKGNAVNKEDGWLFVSLPYSRGWKCSIDGNETQIFKADYSFMAVYVPQGKHQIVFEYETPGIVTGGMISIVCIFAFAFVIYRYKKEHIKSKG